MNSADPFYGPPANCEQCSRLADYRAENRAANPDWFNAPVPSFGDPAAKLLIVGLAPGVTGANRTGRPFTGDFAGDLLYDALLAHGFAEGTYGRSPDDGLALRSTVISNAVRCVPPQNKPTGAEIKNCRPYLNGLIETLAELKAILCLGRIAHESVMRVFGLRLASHPFAHGAAHLVGGLTVYDSYHCSRYNTNTGRLTEEMFHAVLAQIREDLFDAAS